MTTEGARLAGRTGANPLGRRHLVVAWTVWAVCCVTVMFALPGRETIPYHLGWAGFALAFGFGTWNRWQLFTSLAWYTLATGAALERSWLLGHIGWDETATEIPLMFSLALLMAWQVRRRRTALAQVTRLAERDVQASRDRERLMQLTSHELRTPLTIAGGYIELLQTRAGVLEDQQDLSVVADELDRLRRVSDRLIRMMRLHEDTTNEIVDFDQVMAQAVERWRVVADRRWMLDAGAGRALGSPERLRTCLDTLIENAIRYTCVGDTIRLVGSRQLQQVVLRVLDDGIGLSDHQLMAINAGEQAPLRGAGPGMVAGTGADMVDPLAGTGLGLSIVREAAHVRGGTLHAAHAPGGGASLTLSYPLNPPDTVDQLVPRVAPGARPMRAGVAEI
jgi:two-component system, OmpR family, sensor kinase